MEQDSSLSCAQQLVICPYSDPDLSIPSPPKVFLSFKISRTQINIYIKFVKQSIYIYIYIYIDCFTNFSPYIYCFLHGFVGLAVTCWPLVPKFAGSNPAEDVGFLGRKKILSTPSFGGEVKPSAPCRRFAACKRSLNLRGSRN